MIALVNPVDGVTDTTAVIVGDENRGPSRFSSERDPMEVAVARVCIEFNEGNIVLVCEPAERARVGFAERTLRLIVGRPIGFPTV